MTYEEIRPRITTGCVICWKGTGFIAWLIRRFSEFSHSSIVIRMDKYANFFNRVFIEEALEHGPTIRYLSKRIREFKGEVWLFIPKGLTLESQNCLALQALNDCALGIRYDYTSLVKNILGRVSTNAKRFFCSEEVDSLLQRCGVYRKLEFRSKKAPRPGDIPKWYDGELIKIK